MKKARLKPVHPNPSLTILNRLMTLVACTPILLLLCGVFPPSSAHAAEYRREPCLPESQRLATDGQAANLVKTNVPLLDRYVQTSKGSESKCIHVVEASGTGSRPLIVLIHGVPQTWYSYRKLIDPLFQAGFDVMAIDLPGLGQSSRPASVTSLDLKALSLDIRELIELTGRRKAIIAGHDIGGTVAWSVAMYEPASVELLMVLSGPHPGTWRKALVEDANEKQLSMSGYAYDFAYHGQFFAYLATFVNAATPATLYFQAFGNLRKKPYHPFAVTPKDVLLYSQEIQRADDARWITRYYEQVFIHTLKIREQDIGYRSDLPMFRVLRKWYELYHHVTPTDALLTQKTLPPSFPKLEAPTLIIYPENDPYNSEVYIDPNELKRTAPVSEVALIKPSSHWLTEDAPEPVFQAMCSFAKNHLSDAKFVLDCKKGQPKL